jgi:hypothetical protein
LRETALTVIINRGKARLVMGVPSNMLVRQICSYLPLIALISCFCMPVLAKQEKAGAKHSGGVSEIQVEQAIRGGTEYIKKKQKNYGSWTIEEPKKVLGGDSVQRQHYTRYEPGVTALALYALLKCDTPLDDKSVTNGINYLLNVGIFSNTAHSAAADLTTYDASMIAVALGCAIEKNKENLAGQPAVFDLPACFRKIADAVQWLVQAQHPDLRHRNKKKELADIKAAPSGAIGYDLSAFQGACYAAWNYKIKDNGPLDNSNTQFALLGLRAAQNIKNARGAEAVDINIPREVWQKALAYLVSMQTGRGWGYRDEPDPLEVFTVAGIGGIIICISSLVENADPAQIMKTPQIVDAMSLWAQTYPQHLSNRMLDGYVFYSIERTCMLGDITTVGPHDWYEEGARMLLARRNSDGYFTGKGPCNNNAVQTALALLFLRKIYVPVR